MRQKQRTVKKLSFLRKAKFSSKPIITFCLIFAVIGGYILSRSFAATSNVCDLNNDGYINVTDLSILLDNYGSTNEVADCNEDGMVYVQDLSILLSHYGEQVTVPAAFPSVLHQCGRHLCDANNYVLPKLKSFNILYDWPQSDFNDMYAQGARMVRVLVIWSKLEPTQDNIDLNYVQDWVDPMVQRAIAAGLYVQLEMVFNFETNWPAWAGAQNMSNFMTYGQIPTQFIANRYADTKGVIGFGIDEPPPDDYKAIDKLPHLEAQERTFIGWFRANAPTWIGVISGAYGGGTPIYNAACAAEQGRQMNGINASESAYDSVGGNVLYDLHDYQAGNTTTILNYDARTFYGDNYDISNGGQQVSIRNATPSVYPNPQTGFQDRADLLTQLKGYVCPIAQYAQNYDGGTGLPVEIGEFGWRVGPSTTVLDAGYGYAAYVDDKEAAWATVSPVIEQQWDYSHNQATGDPYAAKPLINGTPTWQPFTLDWLASP